jgi:hypothetical protein
VWFSEEQRHAEVFEDMEKGKHFMKINTAELLFFPPEQELCQNCPSLVIFEWTTEGLQRSHWAQKQHVGGIPAAKKVPDGD